MVLLSREEEEQMMDVKSKELAEPESSPDSSNSCCNCCCCPKSKKMRYCCVGFLTLFVVLATAGLVNSFVFRTSLFQYPFHASCNVSWTFQENCDGVASKLIQQMEVWKTNATCGTGQKCLYTFESTNGNLLKATHTTPKAGYIDDLEFKFYPNAASGGCNVMGFSTSRIFFAVLDFGTNICNLRNIVEGAGLNGDPSYTESSRNEICTQYTTADCEKY